MSVEDDAEDPPQIEARVEQVLSSLSLADKLTLTAGATLWTLPPLPTFPGRSLAMSDGPSGVRGTTFNLRSLSFPCGMALGASWDPELIGRVGRALGEEAASKQVQLLLGPTVCIPRTPLGGRTFESFAEDPHLTTALAVAYIQGVQHTGVGCCVKHFACNDQETDRMTIDARVDPRTLREVHLPAFEAAVRDAEVVAVMAAYNRTNGSYCSENASLLTDVLKEEWEFDGIVVSDWFGTHSGPAALLAGLDLEMPGPPSWLGQRLADACQDGTIPEDRVNDAARRVIRLMFRVGHLETTAPTGTEHEENDPDRRRLARLAATKGIVLLRNEAVLPLRTDRLQRVALIGPNARRLSMGGGGSATVTPFHVASCLTELRSRLDGIADVTFEDGCSRLGGVLSIDPSTLAPPGGGAETGFLVEYFDRDASSTAPTATELHPHGRLLWLGAPLPGLDARGFRLRASAIWTPDAPGPWRLALESAGKSRLLVDGDVILDNWDPVPGKTFLGFGSLPVEGTFSADAGRTYDVVIDFEAGGRGPISGVRLGAEPAVGVDSLERAVTAAQDADVAVVVVGMNDVIESEGFDRPGLGLPAEQDELISRIAAVNPATVVVVNAGSPVAMPWVNDVGAVVMLWYPGEEGAGALVDVLLGAVSPSGRLPITFPVRIEDTPAHGNFPGSDGKVRYEEGLLVGYRHYDDRDIEPLFAFGHGLSYGEFRYGDLRTSFGDTGALEVDVDVENAGAMSAIETVQLFLGRTDRNIDEPRRTLAAFTQVELAPGESGCAHLCVGARSFSRWHEDSRSWQVRPGDYQLSIGSSSRDLRCTATLRYPGTG